jgi:hemoglobin-like flavoprotein
LLRSALALPRSNAGMTPEQIEIVEDTAGALDVTSVAADFYGRAFRRDPALPEMFTLEPAIQQARFAAELSEIVASIRRLDRFCPAVRALGARHRAYGVRAAHYRLMGEVLLETLAAALGREWTPAVSEAWTLAYALTAETMQAGALDVPPDRGR